MEFTQCCQQFVYSSRGRVRQYPGQNSVWVLDGAAIHRDAEIAYFLRSIGVVGIPPITWTLYTGIVRPGLWCVQGCIVQTFLRSGLVSFRSRGRWLIFGVVGQAHMRLWLCQDRWHSRSRGPCTLPWALPCLRVLVAVSSVTSRATKPIHNRRKLCHSPDHSTNSTCHTPP